MILTEKHKIKLLNDHLVSKDKLWWCYEICSKNTITETQYATALQLYDMNKREQRKYIIFQDQLVKVPTNVKMYTASPSTGVWKRNRLHEGNNRKG